MTGNAEFWDKVAKNYAAKPVEDPAAFERKIAIIKDRMTAQDAVLDEGCDKGTLALRLAPAGRHIHGLDVSGEMIRIANGKASDQGIDYVTFHTGPFDETFSIFEPESLDGICACSVLHLVLDRRAVLDRVYALLKPGGFFVSSTVCLDETWVRYRQYSPSCAGSEGRRWSRGERPQTGARLGRMARGIARKCPRPPRVLACATMATKLMDVRGPGPALRFVFRMPIWLYHLHLGWLLGSRFLLINHVGAKTGLARRSVVEVIKKDAARHHYWVASGYGERANWYKNLVKTPAVSIQVGSRVLHVMAHELEASERSDLMVEYAAEHPTASKQLMGMLGYSVDGSDEDYREVGRTALRMFVFRPRASA